VVGRSPSAVVRFPSAADPFAVEPPVMRGALKCTSVIFVDVELTNYGQVASAPYVAGDESCLEDSVAVLTLQGHLNAGRQFDRYGALWLGGVELLRTTTPEPNADRAITWTIDRDITDYAALLRSNTTAVLSIPNTVDGTYTGVLKISVNVSFYANPTRAKLQAPDFVFALNDPTAAKTSPWSVMGLSGNATAPATLRLPFRNAARVIVDVYASAHGCDEFWYTNVPGNSPPDGFCGGGAFRELRISVDGELAAIALPFPVIYTGGVNPLAWRPLTGIASLDVPPYSMDLTPYASVLNDGLPHVVTVQVASGDAAGGLWYLDAVAKIWRDTSVEAFVGASIDRHEDPLDVGVVSSPTKAGVRYATTARHGLAVHATATGVDAGGREVKQWAAETAFHATLSNTNDVVDDGTQRTTAVLFYETTANSPSGFSKSTFEFPIAVGQSYPTANSSQTDVSLEYRRKVALSPAHGAPFSMSWASAINATAALVVVSGNDVGSAATEAAYNIATGEPCYARNAAAKDGAVISDADDVAFSCAMPGSLRFCGLELCGAYDASEAAQVHVAVTARIYVTSPHAFGYSQHTDPRLRRPV